MMIPYRWRRKAVRVRRLFWRIDLFAESIMDWLVAVLLYRGGTGPITLYFDGFITESPSAEYDGHIVVRQFGEQSRYAWVGFRLENRNRMRRIDRTLIAAVVSAALADGYQPMRLAIRGKAYGCYSVTTGNAVVTQ